MGRSLRLVMAAILASLALVLIAGCNPNLGVAPFKCSSAGQCPDGYECNSANLCVKDKNSCPDEVPGCGATKEECGDGKCTGEETCESCDKDCGKCDGAHCGDDKCEGDEDCKSCEKDCGKCTTGPASCGDDKCEDPETCSTCEADCGKCGGKSCGDDKCEDPETCSTCEADCGKCASGCGDGECKAPAETCSNCEADCGKCPVNKCPNGTCDVGETPATCPADCKEPVVCQTNETKCKDDKTLDYCDNGQWKTDTCDTICTTEGFDYPIRCELATDVNKEICLCGNFAKFGEICTPDVQCAPDLFCGAFGTSATKGYCTKYCTNIGGACAGAPLGTAAECVLEVNAKHVCGFTCSSFIVSCPNGMTCDVIDSYCKP